jgi:hypothetical protein
MEVRIFIKPIITLDEHVLKGYQTNVEEPFRNYFTPFIQYIKYFIILLKGGIKCEKQKLLKTSRESLNWVIRQ